MEAPQIYLSTDPGLSNTWFLPKKNGPSFCLMAGYTRELGMRVLAASVSFLLSCLSFDLSIRAAAAAAPSKYWKTVPCRAEPQHMPWTMLRCPCLGEKSGSFWTEAQDTDRHSRKCQKGVCNIVKLLSCLFSYFCPGLQPFLAATTTVPASCTCKFQSVRA